MDMLHTTEVVAIMAVLISYADIEFFPCGFFYLLLSFVFFLA